MIGSEKMPLRAFNAARDATKAALFVIMVVAGFLTCGMFGGSFDISAGRALSLVLVYCLIAPVMVLSSPALYIPFGVLFGVLVYQDAVRPWIRDRRFRRGRCMECSYIVAGTRAEVCSECGRPLEAPPAPPSSTRTILLLGAGALSGVILGQLWMAWDMHAFREEVQWKLEAGQNGEHHRAFRWPAHYNSMHHHPEHGYWTTD